MRIHYRLSETDRQMIDWGRRSQLGAGRAVGTFDGADSEVLPLGGSQHSTGTVRIVLVDGTCVADPNGRVWGTDGIFVGGNGAVPTALSCNSTLTAAVLAVRTARAAVQRLTETSTPSGRAYP